MKRKEQLLIYSLGRETTAYDAANVFGLSPEKTGLTSSEYGAWYNCKRELFDEELVIPKQRKGRNKPIRANMSKYINVTLREIPVKKNFGRKIIPVFEKYAPKIVDFLIENKSLSERYDQSYPVVFFLLARYLAAFVNDIQPLSPGTAIGEVYSFVKDLSDDERKELSVPAEQQQQNLEVAFTLLPPQLFKEVFMHMGTRVFAEIVFRKKQIDKLIEWIYLGSEEDIQFLREKIEERKRQKELEGT